MKIGIDASRAFALKKTGTETYSHELIKSLAMMDTSGHQIFLYVMEKSAVNFSLPDNFFAREIKTKKFWTQRGLSLEMMKNPVDLLFVPSYSVPIIHPSKTIVTIHGLEYKHCAECYYLKSRILLELNTLISANLSCKIIAPSENTKKDLVKFYKVNPDKVKVIYHGTESIQYPVLSIKHPDKESFSVLFIGRLEKRKNLVNLIKAFELFKNNSKFKIPNSKLILAGEKGFGFEEIKKTIDESPHKNDIILKGYVSEEEKERLYGSADLFVFPSLYEGFGLPVLEAMSYGVPVVCSNNSSLPEVAGKAALLVDPYNIKEIAMAMNKVFSDADLREEMVKKGFENVKRFSWEKCARETIDVLLNC